MGEQVPAELLHVLFVEDDPEIASMYKLKLEADGYEVAVAADGVAGLLKARINHPDLIFLDIRLPKLDGFRVLAMLREDKTTSQIPVVILSNYGEEELVKRGLALGAMDYLIKAEVAPGMVSAGVPDWVTRPVAR